MNAKLIIALMYSDKEIFNKTISDLKNRFGEIEKESESYDFNFTKYYEKEMGAELIKKFIVFKKPIGTEELADIKLFTTEIEKKYSIEGKRKINLDPGYLTKTELVLASFKKGTNYKQQISDKVWAHKVLEFDGNIVKEFWHTFPDYKSEMVKGFFIDFIS